MLLIVALISGPFVIAVAAALCIRTLVLRDLPRLDRRLTMTTALAGVLPVLAYLLFAFSGLWFSYVPTDDLGLRALFPLLLGIFAVVVAAIPPASSRDRASATLSPRRLALFLAPRWIVTTALLGLAIVVLTAVLGEASSPDEQGRFTQYEIAAGSAGAEARTTIYGWYYSTPSLFALAALLVLTAIAWALIPRRRWDADDEHDAAVRRLRTANIGRVAAGALVLHLAVLLGSVGGTAQLALEVGSSDLGRVAVGTPFAALGPLLSGAALAAQAIGIAFWLTAALTAVPSRSRVLVRAR